MVQTGFHIGNRDWWVMALLDIDGVGDLNKVYESLLSVGAPDYKAREVCMVLSRPNTAYTFTDYDGRFSLIFVARTTDASQMYDSIDHEKNHVVSHICKYYNVERDSEEASYLAGELGRLLFPAAALVLCPCCHREKYE